MTEKKLFKSRREGILNNFIEARCSCGPCGCTICGGCTHSTDGSGLANAHVSNSGSITHQDTSIPLAVNSMLRKASQAFSWI